MDYKLIANGSVTTPAGFQAAGIKAGLKQSGALDMALLVSECPAVAAAAFTSNKFAAPPVRYDEGVIAAGGAIRAIIINSGNANACTGEQGMRDVHTTAQGVASRLGINPEEVLVSSTGRIGVPMPMPTILAGVESAVNSLSNDGGLDAASAIMTTDTVRKSLAVSLQIGGKTVHIGGMTKGAGMIAPKLIRPAHRNEATMLAYVTTDAAVTPGFLDACLGQSLDKSFNRITIDGDTSTNDSFVVLANGRAGNAALTAESPDATKFVAAFNYLVGRLAKEMVLDGEGVTRFVELKVCGARTDEEARTCAETIANSALCKTAWFGADPNWGRILDAAGYAGVDLNPDRVNLDYEGIPIVRGGMDVGTPAAEQVKAIDQREFRIDLELGVGTGEFTIWTCDLSYEYVRINADYHT
jgi:glutamate N-acetyltransferase/amino-acid N-acetyltransferase